MMKCDFCEKPAEFIGIQQCVVYCLECEQKGEEAENNFLNSLSEQ